MGEERFEENARESEEGEGIHRDNEVVPLGILGVDGLPLSNAIFPIAVEGKVQDLSALKVHEEQDKANKMREVVTDAPPKRTAMPLITRRLTSIRLATLQSRSDAMDRGTNHRSSQSLRLCSSRT